MKTMKIFLILAFSTALSLGFAQAPLQQANTDLDTLAQEVVKLCAVPGFRGFLRSEIAKSKNSENIIELDTFLDRASKQQNMPPGIVKVKDAAVRAKNASLKAFSREGRLDLYIPVKSHRLKWSGGDDFLVTSTPLDIEDVPTRQIVAYQARDGKRVILDPKKAPNMVVLTIAACEHETHEVKVQVTPEPIDRSLPTKVDFVGKDAPNKPVKQDSGQSFLGIRRIYIRDMMESWLNGSPEINIYICQKINNTYCAVTKSIDSFSITYYCDNDHTWYTVWSPPDSTKCVPQANLTTDKLNGYHVCRYFNNYSGTQLWLSIWEGDYGGSLETKTRYADGAPCLYNVYSSDDPVDGGSVYITNFGYNTDYVQDMGNAIMRWYKIP